MAVIDQRSVLLGHLGETYILRTQKISRCTLFKHCPVSPAPPGPVSGRPDRGEQPGDRPPVLRLRPPPVRALLGGRLLPPLRAGALRPRRAV